MKSNFLLVCLLTCFSLLTANAQEIMLLKTSGKVVIGDTSQITTPGNYNLYVQNGILTEKVKVSIKTTSEWSDQSFENTPTINEVEKSIIDNKHLIGVPSAAEVVKHGYEVTAMDAKLLEQIEWLWQHMITLEKENAELKKRIETMEVNKK